LTYIKPPRSVKIELTARCDFQCFFCASSLRLRDKADIDPDLRGTVCEKCIAYD
jgi:molybdenum cofactor biosynthesis enzyme MoaA